MTKSKGSSKTGNTQEGAAPKAISNANLVSQVIDKMTSEPLLLVIAIVVLIVGFVSQAGISSADVRFVVIVIAVLAAVAIVGYYVVQVLLARPKAQVVAVGTVRPGPVSRVDVERVAPEAEAVGVDAKQVDSGENLEADVHVGVVEGKLIGMKIERLGGSSPPQANPPGQITPGDKGPD